MQISEEEIHLKKQELGVEPEVPSHGPASAVSDSLEAARRGDAAEVEGADITASQQLDEPPGTNQRNQYRYGGERP